jgi:hypothetical protein
VDNYGNITNIMVQSTVGFWRYPKSWTNSGDYIINMGISSIIYPLIIHPLSIIEGYLEVKLPTYGQMQQQSSEESEKRG